MQIKLVSLMAENTAFFYRGLGPYLGSRTGLAVQVESRVNASLPK